MATTTHHPTQKTYWLVALLLVVVTAIEIAIPYLSAFDSVRAPLLIASSRRSWLMRCGGVSSIQA